jgi:hypothetical protein
LRASSAVAFMAVGSGLSLGGSSVFSRAETNDVRAVLGQGPELGRTRHGGEPDRRRVFLLVSLPLFAAGLLLDGSG